MLNDVNNEQLDLLKKEHIKLKNEYEKVFQYTEEKLEEIKELKKEKRVLQNKNKELRKDINIVTKRLEKEHTEHKNTSLQLKIINEKLNQLEQESDEQLRIENLRLADELNLKTNIIKELQREIKRLENKINIPKQESTTEEVYRLNQLLIDAQRQLLQRESEIEHMQCIETSSNNEQLRIELNDAQKQLLRYENQLSVLQNKLFTIKNEENEIIELEATNFQQSELIKNLEVELEKMRNESEEQEIIIAFYKYKEEQELNSKEEIQIEYEKFVESYEPNSLQPTDKINIVVENIIVDDEFDLDQDGELAVKLLGDSKIHKNEFKTLLSTEQEMLASFVARVNGFFEDEYELELICETNDYYYINEEVIA